MYSMNEKEWGFAGSDKISTLARFFRVLQRKGSVSVSRHTRSEPTIQKRGRAEFMNTSYRVHAMYSKNTSVLFALIPISVKGTVLSKTA